MGPAVKLVPVDVDADRVLVFRSDAVDFRGVEGDEEAAAGLIKKIDKARENYIQRYTDTSRYDVHNYDLAIKVDGQSEEQIAETIISFIEQGKDIRG